MSLRTLADAAPQPAAAVGAAAVTTLQELRAAVARGESHIEIRSHLDLRGGLGGGNAAGGSRAATIPAAPHAGPAAVVTVSPLELLTIRGNCSAPPPPRLLRADAGPAVQPMLHLQPQQCLILLDSPFLHSPGPASVWLDGLYLRLQRNPATAAPATAAAAAPVLVDMPAAAEPGPQHSAAQRSLWLTEAVVQGDASPQPPQSTRPVGGLRVDGGRVLADRCTFVNLGGNGATAPLALSATSADFVDCQFRDNLAAAAAPAVIVARRNASVALRGCTFSGNGGEGHLLYAQAAPQAAPQAASQGAPMAEADAGAAAFFSDDETLPVCQFPGGFSEVLGLDEVDTALQDMEQALLGMEAELGPIHRPLAPQHGGTTAARNDMGCCGASCATAATPAAALSTSGGASVSAATGRGLPVPAGTSGGDSGGEMGLDSPGAVGLAASALALAAIALVVVVVYAVRLRQRRQRYLARQNVKAMAKVDMHEDHEYTGPETPVLSGDEGPSQGLGSAGSLSFFCQLKTPSKLSDGASCVVPQAASLDLQPGTYTPPAPASLPADCTIPVPSIFAGLMPDAAHDARYDQSSAQSAVRSSEATGDIMSPGPPLEGWNDTCSIALNHSQGHSHGAGRTAGTDDGYRTDAGGMHVGPAAVEATGSSTERVPAGVSDPDMSSASPASDLRQQVMRARAVLDTSGSDTGGHAGGLDLDLGGADSGSPARVDSMCAPGATPAAARRSVSRIDSAGCAGADGGPTVPGACGESAPVQAQLAIIGQQLAAFGPRDLLLGRYEVLGGQDQCHGGRAVVQFVKVPDTDDACALKFFADRAAFEDERRLYLHSAAGRFMPTVLAFVPNEDGSFCDPFDNPMPPCIVMETGEMLTERIARSGSDTAAMAQVIREVASCLAELHSQGWVHRDLKPGNIMFLPRTGSWAVINFGHAARVGESVRVAFTFAYAAPEAVALHAQDIAATVADPAVDAWALGVIAYELLTGQPASHLLIEGAEEAERQLLGHAPLPWEQDPHATQAQQQLEGLWEPLLRMLSRDPAQRASCEEFADMLRAPSMSPSRASTGRISA